ncbi:EAL domain-containing protein [Chitinispirillales bacterium ANBcel5]|uniref:putative bifunctional diguanylate cyclase/phosphodiesterase n=1 Tax=Cellulosispirillum alkaliphilum TaxID=3039283 RepID=UPI002A4FD468|nr:EAL domain-containing protein [Chitinispirillales bacterium ANBcel5]
MNRPKTRKQLQKELETLKVQLKLYAPEKNEKAKNKLKLWDVIFTNASEGIVITDDQGIIESINPGFSTITKYSTTEVIGRKISILKSNRHNSTFYHDMWHSLNKHGVWQGEIWNRRKDGEIYPEWLSIKAVKDSENQVRQYVGIFSDISQNIRNQNHGHAYYDPLTGLPNRLLLHDRLSFMLNHARRTKSLMALLLLDLNRFKIINDTLGYLNGDILLQTIANRLNDSLRDVDAVFRLGDDEFAIILEEISQQQDAAKVAKRILTLCTQPIKLDDHELYVTTSIGISIFPSDGENPEQLLKNAEAAMQRAKEMGINNYQHYKPAMNAKAFEQLTLEHNLRKALKRDEFVLFYQPQIDTENQTLIGVEALIRWNHPQLGMIPPAQFIPIAEETGIIIPIGEWVLFSACEQLKYWQKHFNTDISVSVNLSARQFQQQDLISTVARVLSHTNLCSNFLQLEITESLGMKNPETTLLTLNKFKDMGIKIAIDDFGTGYSSLSYLKKFPIHTLKIDRSFVKDISIDPNDEAIVKAIIVLAQTMNLEVIAEGVEKDEQLQYLIKQGCKKVQGYLYSPPVDTKKLEILFTQLDPAKIIS